MVLLLFVVIQEHAGRLLHSARLPLASAAAQMADVLLEVLQRAAILFLVLGVWDFFRQKQQWMKGLRMTKQEIRDEWKEQEGSPEMKGRIRRMRRDLLRRRMMHAVPTATAVIVNPTHFAIAIKYEAGAMGAPKVVAKGRNYLAQRIRELAVRHQVPIIENPPLAQALYKTVEVGQEIPVHLYRAVAEVLAYLHRLMHGRTPGLPA
jgi:flagellar biosynthetic protein FlhB